MIKDHRLFLHINAINAGMLGAWFGGAGAIPGAFFGGIVGYLGGYTVSGEIYDEVNK